MDPMDYTMHSPTRLSSLPEPIHGAPGSWMSHGHPPTHPSPWAGHHAAVPQYYHPQRSYQFSPYPYPLGTNGGLPLPDPSFRGLPLPDPFAGQPSHPRPWGHHFQPMQSSQMPAPIPPNHMNMNMHGTPAELPFGLVLPAGSRGMSLQPTGGEPGLGPPGATSEHHTLPPRPMFTPSAEHSVNALGQQIAASHFSVSPPQANPPPSRRASHHALSNAPRPSRTSIPVPSFPPLPQHQDVNSLSSSSHRRTGHTRGRRSMNNRLTMSDPSRDVDDDMTGHEFRVGGFGHRPSQSLSEEPALRQMQVLRGAVSSKMVVSRSALQTLISVKIENLPENDRTCVICYNDYGVQTPEGISEAPLQLPKCKHVFGDHCIKKWFEDSDSCPYCRDKLHSEPKHHLNANSTRAFLNMMRIRGPLPPGLPDEVYLRFMSGLVAEESLAEVVSQPVERRSPPHDAEAGQRRTRQRRSSRSGDDVAADRDNTGEPVSSPIRIPTREPSQRHQQWMSHTSQRRASYAALNQNSGLDHAGHRQQGSHSRFPVGAAMMNGGLDTPAQNPLQESRTERLNTASVSSSGVEIQGNSSNEGENSITSAEQRNSSMAPLSVEQIRNRPW